MTAAPIALWAIPVGQIGGVARHVLDVTAAGIPGWRVVVLCPEGPLAEELRDAGRPVVTAPFGPDAGLSASVASLRRTAHALRPRVVHTHLAHADVVSATAFAGRRGRPFLVSTEHGIAVDDRVYHGNRAKSALMASVHTARCAAFDALIAVSESTRDAMRAKWHVRRPISVLYNGVDRPTPPPMPTPGLRLVSIARFAPEKNLDAALRAFAVLRAEHPDATFVLAGTGPLDSQMRELARTLGLGDSVSFPGHVDPAPVLAESDVLIQLSVWENCSYTILDALAHRLGVVATPVGGNPELLPATCLVEAQVPAAVAAAAARQGLLVERRPGLRAGWPTTSDTAAAIASVYDALPA